MPLPTPSPADPTAGPPARPLASSRYPRHPLAVPGPRGSALVGVLWAVAILSILAASASFTVTLDLRVTKNLTDEIKASCIAESGVAVAMALLARDDRQCDSFADDWHENPSALAAIQVGDGECSVVRPSADPLEPLAYGIEDEESKLNVNTATREMLMALPGIEADLADAIIDWRDADSLPEPLGAEQSYYASLPHPYLPRDGPFETLHELLLVRGVTPEALFSEDTNDNGTLDANEDDGALRAPARPVASSGCPADGVLDRGFGQFLTPYSFAWNRDAEGRPRVDLNTASEATVAAVPGISPAAAKAVIAYRAKNTFTSIADLLEVTLPAEQKGEETKSTEATPERKPEAGQQEAAEAGGERPEAGVSPLPSGLRPPASDPPSQPVAETSGRPPEAPATQAAGAQEGAEPPKPDSPAAAAGHGERVPRAGERPSGPESPTAPEGAQPQAEPPKAFTIETFRAIIDRVTASADDRLLGRINVNTAPREVLRAVPGLDETLVENLIAARTASPLRDLGGLFDVSGMTLEAFKEASPHLCVRSVHFRIRSLARLPGTRIRKSVDCVVRRDEDELDIVYWRQGSGR